MLKITKNQGSIQVTADKSGFYPFDGTITFPTNSLFTATSANTDMITFKSTSNGDVQFVGNYKDITISGRSYDTKQKFLTAFSNLANQGSVDAYTKAETDAKIDAKQDKLTAGTGITIDENNVISSTGGSGGGANPMVNVKGTNGNATIADNVTDGIAIGSGASVTKKNSVAIGNGATSGSGGSNIAIGILANSSGGTSIAIGKNAETSNIQAIAIGTLTGAYIPKSIAIGYGAKTSTNIPMVINAGGKTMFQGDTNGKISIPLGDGTDERMVIQDEIEALKNAGGGTVDAYTKAETDTKLDAKQDKLTAGSGITITKDETAGTSTIATAVSLTDNGEGAYQVGDSIEIGSDTVVIGKSAISRSETSIAIGKSATSGSGTTNVAIGNIANSSGGSSIAIGDKSETSNFSAIAIGTSTGAYLPYSIAIGNNAKAVTNKPMVINAGGKTMIQSDSNGKISLLKGDGTDERMVIQDEIEALKNAGGSGGSANPLINVKGTDSATITDTVTDAVAIGSGAKVTEELSVAIGAANALSGHCVAIGGGAYATKMSSVAIGDGACATAHMFDVAIGFHAATTDTKPLEINAGYKTVGGATTPLTVLQSDSTGKLSILKGDGTDERIVIQDALSAGGSGGTVDAYTKAETDTKLEAKQDKLTAGNGITIDENNVISSTGGSGGGTNPLVNVKGTDSATITDTVTDAVAIGSGASVEDDSCIAIGKDTLARAATGQSSVAIGSSAVASPDFPLVINAGAATNGNAFRMIQGDKNGKVSIPLGNGTLAMMCLQDEIEALKNAGGSGVSGGGANPLVNVKGTGSATIADSVTEAVAIGSSAKVSRNYGVSVGYQCKSGNYSVAIGKNAQTSEMSSSSIAIGDGANTGMLANNTIAVGTNARANSSYSLAIGKNATTSNDTPMVINAGSKTMIQSDANGKISLLKGDGTDERMVIQDEIAALKAEIAALKGGASTGDTTGA